MSKLRLAMACWNYDRTRALLEDHIPVDGIDLTYINIPVEETFFRMIRHREFDVAEMSIGLQLGNDAAVDSIKVKFWHNDTFRELSRADYT